MPYRFPKTNNPWYPLPADYPSLGTRGQKLARLNTVCLQETPSDFVTAWALFREYYLFPTPKGQFYEGGVVPSPLFHYQIVRDVATYPMNAWGAPRSAAKSMVLGTEAPLMLAVTRRYFTTGLILSKMSLITKRFDKFMAMIEDNPRIIEDFGPLRPPRGRGQWNHSAIRLANGSAIFGFPVEGQLLGIRYPLILLDDVEFDPALVHQPTSKAEKMEYLLNVVILPMREQGTCIGIIGTTHRKDFYLHHVMTSKDPKFSKWNRRAVTVYNTDGSLMWGEKLSEEFLKEQRELMGSAASFEAAYLGKPGTDADRLLHIHPTLGQYRVEDQHGNYLESPLVSDALLVSHRKTRLDEKTGEPGATEEKRPLNEALSKLWRLICVDPALGRRSGASDYSAIIVVGFENSESYRDVMWVLDLWLGKVTEDALVKTIWKYGQVWGVHAVGVEDVGTQHHLVERMQTEYGDQIGRGWVPRVIPVKYPGNQEKGLRIAGLEWRFNQGRVKLPLHRRNVWPMRELYQQVENATFDLALLKHDDAVDALAMTQFVVRPRRQQDSDVLDPALDPVELLRAGETNLPSGETIVSSLALRDLTPEVVGLLRERYMDDQGIPRREDDND